ncbi:hypothetical protein GUITHDRAFT_106949 [Guillardia theta CCMP2712]|uniref:Transcription factor CBF/NF-Y/archaeal histone domain-containing protein n=1 Tax=Guillardia theta (strain CCMP2712) TaxID=905079 RepID=L1JEW1_GUITC|nr:hypothetical protein GUITHDRAFT_106949 [Guillardia theta CCMP2712]EKX47036.1 hypothetical protein GUITHDRAFT_106949 [Guillardia theta CCMP2712]|eukprot:XP_005834016.1 hypothetical protein GUITHDRAFT_106949 [Guillardia theta CCMP2712]
MFLWLGMPRESEIANKLCEEDVAVAKEARVALSACATVFIHYITELAVQQCDKRKKVTLNPEDIIEALREAEFEEFEETLVQSLNNFRNQISNAKKTSAAKRQKLADPEEAGADNAGQAIDNDNSASQADGGQDDEQVAESEKA